MKVVVVSDNHFNLESLEQILKREHDADLFIHCGDSQFHVTDPIMQHFITVRGNNDERHYENERLVSIGNVRVLVTHGDLYGIDFSTNEVCESAHIQKATAVFHGHTHIPRDITVDNIRIINPGSTAWPRGGFKEGTYAVIDATESDVAKWDVEFISTKTWETYPIETKPINKKWWQL